MKKRKKQTCGIEIAEKVLKIILAPPFPYKPEPLWWTRRVEYIQSTLKSYANQKLEKAGRLADFLEAKYDSDGVIGIGNEIRKLKEE